MQIKIGIREISLFFLKTYKRTQHAYFVPIENIHLFVDKRKLIGISVSFQLHFLRTSAQNRVRLLTKTGTLE